MTIRRLTIMLAWLSRSPQDGAEGAREQRI